MEEAGRSPQGDCRRQARASLIVGIGAAASAVNSIERFFSTFSLDAEQAIVLVLQHREALDESWLSGIVEGLNGIRLAEPHDGSAIEGGTIYLCAADAITTLHDDRFAVRPAQQAPEERGTIDSFLVSLAEAYAEDAIGVVLAGTGGDGTLGVATLKDHGGLALAEKAANECTGQLAGSSTPAAIADLVLSPEQIPEHIQVYARVYARHLRRLEEKQGHVDRLESELRATRERLQATIEKLESTNEELKSSNAAYQSLNEKLQSANQELTTVNGELAHGVQQLTRAEERQNLLLAELQHRVRNTLGVVRSIARRSAETSSSVEDYASHLDGRLHAFARTQAMVSRDPEGGVDLEYLVVEELLGYNAREGEQLRVAGPPVRFQPKAAETFALAIHELATNAVKYGALSQPSGQVDVSWLVDDAADPAQLIFDWRERGGPSVKTPQRKGFGSELLERTLAFELKGCTTVTYDASGLHCTIAIPLNRRVVHTPLLGG